MNVIKMSTKERESAEEEYKWITGKCRIECPCNTRS